MINKPKAKTNNEYAIRYFQKKSKSWSKRTLGSVDLNAVKTNQKNKNEIKNSIRLLWCKNDDTNWLVCCIVFIDFDAFQSKKKNDLMLLRYHTLNLLVKNERVSERRYITILTKRNSINWRYCIQKIIIKENCYKK